MLGLLALLPRRAVAVLYAVDSICRQAYTVAVSWDVEYTDEFNDWWNGLTDDEQDSVAVGIRKLETLGFGTGLSAQLAGQGLQARAHAGAADSGTGSTLPDLFTRSILSGTRFC
jgi:hypothetical protein